MSQEVKDIAKSIQVMDKIEDVKNSVPVKAVITPLINNIPFFGDVIDSSFDVILTYFQESKRENLIETILKTDKTITSEMVNNVEFIMNFVRTLEAVNKLANNDKVIYFGNLLRNSYLVDNPVNNDVFEQYLDILSTITYRDINYLLFLKNTQVTTKSELKKYHEFNELFKKEFGTDAYSHYQRLKRTGFVDENYYIPEMQVYEARNDCDSGQHTSMSELDSTGFYTTDLFDEFCKLVLEVTSESQKL